jgi:hypothetical protein
MIGETTTMSGVMRSESQTFLLFTRIRRTLKLYFPFFASAALVPQAPLIWRFLQ